MAEKVWKFRLKEKPYKVRLQHGYFTGKKAIYVNNKLVFNEAFSFVNMGSDHSFEVDNYTFTVHIRSRNVFFFQYDLSINGRSIESKENVVQLLPTPTWVWLFVAACGLIPIVALGFFPSLIGMSGAASCVIFSRLPRYSTETKIGICVGITIVSWALFGGFVAIIQAVLR